MRRRSGRDPGFPPHLATLEPTEWLEPDDAVRSPAMRLFRCWSRWIGARDEFLRRAGYSADKAQELGFADLPAGLVAEAVRLGNSASKSLAGPPYSGAGGIQGDRAVPTFPPP